MSFKGQTFLIVLEVKKSKIKVLADSVSVEDSLPGLPTGFSLCMLMTFTLIMNVLLSLPNLKFSVSFSVYCIYIF